LSEVRPQSKKGIRGQPFIYTSPKLESVARNIYYYVVAAHLYLSSWYKKMTEFGQLGTYECFAIFTAVKFNMSYEDFSDQDYSSVKLPFVELKAKAQSSL
jgi:hypothetical protein